MTMPSQYEGECKLCNKAFKKGDQIHISKVNEEWVKCVDEDCFKEQGGKVFEKKAGGKFGGKFVSQKFPIGDAPKIYCLAEELLKTFYSNREAKDILTIDQEAIFMESIFRTLSQNFKPEVEA
ncbi:MAG: hypothetical protein H8D23_01435 [Candidatus Brocadiales bacterium]|nr:hypothetical protein [Candidatus Brocadiales bacterium]